MSDLERGRCVARVLRGAWRAVPPPADCTEAELAEASRPLLRSGSAPLAWWVVRRGDLRASPPARALHEAYALAALQATLREQALSEVLGRLEAAAGQPILGKGWLAARLYPEPGLRPSGDFDLYAPRAEAAALRSALAGRPDIDVHDGLAQLDDRGEDDVRARARVLEVGGRALRVFSEEDHLRLLSLHFLGHGGWRPAWLCDVAAALETRGPAFRWDDVLAGDARRTDWTACAIVLAHHLLGASLGGVPDRVAGRRLPRWLAPAVVRQWGSRDFQAHGRRTELAGELGRPLAVLRGLRIRWPNAVEASVGMRAPFNDLPRFPIRVAESVRRTIAFASRLRAGPL